MTAISGASTSARSLAAAEPSGEAMADGGRLGAYRWRRSRRFNASDGQPRPHTPVGRVTNGTIDRSNAARVSQHREDIGSVATSDSSQRTSVTSRVLGSLVLRTLTRVVVPAVCGEGIARNIA